MRMTRLTTIRVLLGIAAMLLLAAPAFAQNKVALVIGVGAYRNAPALPNPPNDARAMAAAPTRLGFDTDLSLDADRPALEAAVRRFGAKSRGAEAAVIFY